MNMLKFTVLLPLALVSTLALAQEKEVRAVQPFTKIANSSSVDVYVKQGSPQRVEVDGRKDAIQNVLTEVSGGQLRISTKDAHGLWIFGHDKNKYAVYVTVEKIDQLDMTGSGSLIAQGPLTGADLAMTLRGSGDLDAEVKLTGNASVSITGSGDAKVRGNVQNLNGNVTGSGDAEFDVTVANQSQFDIAGSGSVRADGQTQQLVATISGSGDLDAAHFTADKVRVRVAGSGEAQVFAKSELDASTAGSGDIEYYGNPAHVTSHHAGSGSINHAD